MKSKFIIIILLLNFYLFSVEYQLLNSNMKVHLLNGNNINDIEFITNDSVVFSSKSEPIYLYIGNIDGKIKSVINLKENSPDIPGDLIIRSLYEIFSNKNNISFYLSSNYVRYNGFYKIDVKNKKIIFITPNLLNYKENIYNIKLNNFPKKNNYINSILKNNYVFYQEDEDEFDNYQEIYKYNIETNENKLFYEKATQAEWIILDDEIIICDGHPGVLVLSSDGVILQYYSNLFYSSAALSPDKTKVIFNGGLFDKDRIDFTDSAGFYGDSYLLTYGLLVFNINQDAKKELIKLSESMKNIKQQERLKEFISPDRSKRVFLNYTLFLTPTTDDVKLSETQELESKTIRKLNKGEKLEYLEAGKGDIIQDRQGRWVKVKTEKGEIGWCFDLYLEDVKKTETSDNTPSKKSNWFFNFIHKIFRKR